MNQEKKLKMDGACIKRIYFFVILALQLIAYPIAVFNIGAYNDWIYYGIILSCFITAAFSIQKDLHSFLQIGAAFFTCIADYCLILGQATREVGVSFFLIVQLFYAARTLFLTRSRNERILNVSIRSIVCILATIAVFMVFGEETEALFVISIIYYVNLLTNIAFAFLHFNQNKRLAIGLTLFALCDTVLGLHEVINLFSISRESLFYQILHPPFALEASFYCPSQVILSVSAGAFHKNKGMECEKITKDIL